MNGVTWMPRPGLPLFKALFNRRWWWSTLLVLLGMAVLARLGFWQLDRLAQRRARNAEIAQQLALPPLSLTGAVLPDDLTSIKYRRVTALGTFDYSHQMGLKLQNWMGAPGIHLITPLVIEGTSQAVLVDRGWIPIEQAAPENWSQFDEIGPVTVTGFTKLSQTLPARTDNAAQASSAEPQLEWYRVDIGAMQSQMPYKLLPIYVLQSPAGDANANLPYRVEPEFDLSDGPHLGYAIQWYIFSLILGTMYVFYVSKSIAT
jgi:surfeit locus 1 family protein